MNFLKLSLIVFLLFGMSTGLLAQSNFDSTKYSPVVLDGKEAYLEIETGKIFYGDHTRSQLYKNKPEQQSVHSSSTTEVRAVVSANVSEGQYSVVKGDTLYSIARKYNLSAAQLARFNQISLATPLRVGQVLAIQSAGDTHSSFSTSVVSDSHYKVRKGDTLYSIARTYGITVYELKQLNNLTSNAIYVHQELRVR